MAKRKLLDVVELAHNWSSNGPMKGDKGAIVDIYDDDKFEVEFVNDDGSTEALLTLLEKDLKPAKTPTWLAFVLPWLLLSVAICPVVYFFLSLVELWKIEQAWPWVVFDCYLILAVAFGFNSAKRILGLEAR